MKYIISFLMPIFVSLGFAHAQGANLVLICKVGDKDFQATYSLANSGHASLVGQVNQSKFACDLQLQEIRDERKGRGISKYSVQSLRTDAKCNQDLSFDLKRGLQEHVDVVIYKNYAEIYLFEGYSKIRCNFFEYNEKNLLEVSKAVNQRKINSLTAKRKTVPLKIKSLQNKKSKR